MPDSRISLQSHNIRIARNTIFLSIRMIIIMCITLYTSRVVLQALGIEDYGLYNVVGGIVSLFAFINGAMSLTTQRYIAYELGQGGHEIGKTFSACVMVHLLIAGVILVLAETVGLYILREHLTIPIGREKAVQWVYQFSILNCIIMILSTPYNGAIVAYEKMQAFAYISLFDACLRLIVAFVITYSVFDKLIIYAFLLFISQLIIRSCYSIYCRKYIPNLRFSFIIDKSKFKQMLSFSGWTLFNNASIIACTQGINLLLNIVFTPVVNAARGIAVQVELAVASFSKSLQTALNPQITKNYAAHNGNRFFSLIFISSKYSFFIMFLLATPIFLEAEYILEWWLVDVPDYTVSFVRIILIVTLVNLLSEPLNTAVSAFGKIKYFQMISGLLLISILPISYFLLQIYYFPPLVFYVYLVMSILTYGYKLLYARAKIKLSLKLYFIEVWVRIIGVVISTLCILLFLKQYFTVDTFIGLVRVVIIYMLVIFITIFVIGMSKVERRKVLCFMRKKIQHWLNCKNG